MEAFLKKFISKDGKDHNYTKIGDAKLNVFGGCYSIPDLDLNEFYTLYKKHVFIEGKQSYLTEKQIENGQMLIDVDFRYSPDVEERQHTKDHVLDLIQSMLDCINKIKKNDGTCITCYIFEKDNVNMQEKYTKDGIHIMINLQMDFTTKIMFRNLLLKELPNIWDDLKIINEWSDVLDEGVIKGHANWQLYGSRKPGNEDYKLKYVLDCAFNNSWIINEKKHNADWLNDNFEKIMARNQELVIMPLNESMQNEYDEISKSRKKPKSHNQVKLITNVKQPQEISNQEELDDYVEDFMSKLTPTEYIIKETHSYTMMLPREYWGPGSYLKWMRVGWALKNTEPRLFVSWLKFSSQSPNFNYSDIGELMETWQNFDTYNKEGLTLRSIIYWCKMSNESEYKNIHFKTIQHYVYYSIKHNTDYDLACVLYQMYKEAFICVSIKDSIWYEFINNRWQEVDHGYSLRSKISVEMYKIYHEYILKKQNDTVTVDKVEKEGKDEITLTLKTASLLKKTCSKNTIMNEAKEIFYDKDFYSKLNTNDYLVGCNNCIIDVKNKCHRKGKHDDYISKTTGIDYKPLAYYEQHMKSTIEAIHTFMNQLFPNDELRTYMWQHLSATLLGTNENQTFNIYTGSGANGKSILINLMSKVLGEYKGTVPITLITQKRTSIGSTSSEIFDLIGKRYAVMQEPSKGDKINEGIMKEITGGDPLQCRPLFQNSIIFRPQFKLVVCTNTLPEITSMDDGTWRRIRVVEFRSKFTNKPFNDPQFPEEDYPHQFMIDTKIDEKFNEWAPIMLSILVDLAYKHQGKVTDCNEVLASSNKYRQTQDIYMEYINTRVVSTPTMGFRLKITTLNDDFKNWYGQQYGNGKNAPVKDLKEYMIKKYGKYPNGGWSSISLAEDVE